MKDGKFRSCVERFNAKGLARWVRVDGLLKSFKSLQRCKGMINIPPA